MTVAGRGASGERDAARGRRVVVRPEPPACTAAEPDESVVFEVLYVDDEIVVVNKPAGLVVHPARGHERGTLVNGLLAKGFFRIDELTDTFGDGDRAGHARPGDRPPSRQGDERRHGRRPHARRARAPEGAVPGALDRPSVRGHRVGQRRGAYDLDPPRSPSDGSDPLHDARPGRQARRHPRARRSHRCTGATHVECTLETGRTHQIRVHLAESGTPVLGDPLYGEAPRDPARSRRRPCSSGIRRCTRACSASFTRRRASSFASRRRRPPTSWQR